MGGGASTLGNKIGTIYQVPDEDINDSLAVRPASKSIAQSRLRSMLFLFTKGIINSTKTLPVGGSEYPGLMQGAHAISKNGVGDQMVPKLEIPVPSDTPSPPARNAGMRASAVMMAKLILDTVPAFKSYTEEEPTTEDLAMANRVRLLLSSPSKYLEFYTTVYEILYDSSTMRSFPVRTITFKNTFLSELMKLIVTEGSCKASFADRVQLFGNRYKAEGIEVIECKKPRYPFILLYILKHWDLPQCVCVRHRCLTKHAFFLALFRWTIRRGHHHSDAQGGEAAAGPVAEGVLALSAHAGAPHDHPELQGHHGGEKHDESTCSSNA